ncbi:MAG: hypothetical protein P8130_05555 [Deltaproteobacteria bacterium]
MREKIQLQKGSFPSEKRLPQKVGNAFNRRPQGLVGRRTSRRFRVKDRLLAVCEAYSGEIFEISRSGFSFQIVHVRKEGEKIARKVKPDPSRRVDIFSPGTCQHLLKNLEIDVIFDQYIGPLYTDSGRILQYRRGVRFAADLTDSQMNALGPYLDCGSEQIAIVLPARA